MTQSSTLGYWESAKASLFAGDYPVSTARTWRMMNNINHLFDEAMTQHRINWIGLRDNAAADFDILRFSNGLGTGTFYQVQHCPWTILRNGLPANIKCRVLVASGDGVGPCTIQATVAPYWVTNLDPPDEDVFWKSSVESFTSLTPAWEIDQIKVFTDDKHIRGLAASSVLPFIGNDDYGGSGAPVASFAAVVKLILKMTGTTGAETEVGAIYGCQLREFV